MGKYAKAAVEAVELIEKKVESNPKNAWKLATVNIYNINGSDFLSSSLYDLQINYFTK